MVAVLLLLLFLLGGFGLGGTGSVEDAVPEQAGGTLPERPDPSGPPWVLLVAEAGEQRMVQGSYCVTDPERGVGSCADSGRVEPEEVTVVRPGERVEVRVLGVDRAEGRVTVSRLGCEAESDSFELAGPETSWTVELGPGAYELRLDGVYEAGSASGDTSGALGLLVDEAAPLGVLPSPAQSTGCG